LGSHLGGDSSTKRGQYSDVNLLLWHDLRKYPIIINMIPVFTGSIGHN
jgi:hypothetical protein